MKQTDRQTGEKWATLLAADLSSCVCLSVCLLCFWVKSAKNKERERERERDLATHECTDGQGDTNHIRNEKEISKERQSVSQSVRSQIERTKPRKRDTGFKR